MHIADVHCTRHSTSSTATIMIKMGLQSTSIQVMMVMVMVVVLYHWYSSSGVGTVCTTGTEAAATLGQNPQLFILVRLDTAAAAHRSSVTISPAVTIATHHLASYLNINIVNIITFTIATSLQWRNTTSLVSGYLKTSKVSVQMYI